VTLTQERQPYGPLTRGEYTVDGLLYVVRRTDLRPRPGYWRWELRLDLGPRCASKREAYVDLLDNATLDDARKRLLGD